jgi:hypothetical protein
MRAKNLLSSTNAQRSDGGLVCHSSLFAVTISLLKSPRVRIEAKRRQGARFRKGD